MERGWEAIRKNLSPRQAAALVDAAEAGALLEGEEGGLRLIALRLALNPSFRLEDLPRIRVEEVDLSKDRPMVRLDTGSRQGRKVSLSRELRDAVAEFVRLRRRQAREKGWTYEFLLTDSHGNRLSDRALEALLLEAADRAGIRIPGKARRTFRRTSGNRSPRR